MIGEDGDHFLKFDDWSMTQLVEGKFNVNNHAHLVRGTDVCRTEWFFHYFKHRDIMEFLSRQGSGRLKLQKAILASMPMALPPVSEQDELVHVLDQLDRFCDDTESHVKRCRQLLAALLSELLNPAEEAPHAR